jgi:hypothetical protein
MKVLLTKTSKKAGITDLNQKKTEISYLSQKKNKNY